MSFSRAAGALARRAPSLRTPLSVNTARTFTSSQIVRGGDSHGSHYDAPGGWLFGVKPGEKYEKEGWEGPMYWGFCGSFGLAIVAYAFKPDTSIQTWALEEARRRLEAEGILTDPDTIKRE